MLSINKSHAVYPPLLYIPLSKKWIIKKFMAKKTVIFVIIEGQRIEFHNKGTTANCSNGSKKTIMLSTEINKKTKLLKIFISGRLFLM